MVYSKSLLMMRWFGVGLVLLSVMCGSVLGEEAAEAQEEVATSEAEKEVVRWSLFNAVAKGEPNFDKEFYEKARKKLEKDWFLIPVWSGGDNFNPVFLPFDYTCESGVADLSQRLTFPSLLSFKFDFVPDNFSARHPGFVYRKKPVWDVKPGQTAGIKQYITSWSATHAIGGSIEQHGELYSGEMIVYDCNGDEVLRKAYSEPVGYFELMGMMVKDWMAYREQPVSEGLYHELTRPMTRDMECVRLYGVSYFKPWRTESEWAVYEEILERDPCFAEVQYWYANQKGWQTDDRVLQRVGSGKALKSHIVFSALTSYVTGKCEDKSLDEAYQKQLKYAETICEGNPALLENRLTERYREATLKEMDALLPVVQRYWRYWPLTYQLGRMYKNRQVTEKAMPLYLMSVRSGYLKGSGGWDSEFLALASQYYFLGYYREAFHCALGGFRDSKGANRKKLIWYISRSLGELFYFKTSSGFQELDEVLDSDIDQMICRMNYYLSGDEEKIKALDRSDMSKYVKYIDELYGLIGEGKLEEAKERLGNGNDLVKKNNTIMGGDYELIRSGLCIRLGELKDAFKFAKRGWLNIPRSRRVGYLLEQCWGDDERGRAEYLAVIDFIFDDVAFWDELIWKKNVDMRGDLDEVRARLRTMNDGAEGLSEDEEYAYWQGFKPFEVEYVCLRMMKAGRVSDQAGVLDLFWRYKQSVSQMTTHQRYHCRIFYIQLVNLLPEDERAEWFERLE